MASSFRGTFFDTEAVRRSLDATLRKSLSKMGAFVRRRAQTSIRKRKGTSPPGSPPFSHTGALRKGILFGYDAGRRSVVVGPVRAGSASGAPAALEYGGTARLRSGARAKVAPRPFMGPALRAELPNFSKCVR